MNDVDEASALETMVQTQVVDRGIRDERVLSAMRGVPREHFLPADAQNEAFADRAVAIGHGQTISQPYIVALMTERLDVREGSRVLEIGTGSGYQTAVLAQLASEVFTLERIKPLLDESWERLMKIGVRNVHFRHGDGSEGWPEAAPFDRILITAGAPELPAELLRTQLVDGGLAILPIGPMERQMLVDVRRHGDELEVTEIVPVRFVKLIGAQGWSAE